MLRQTLRAAAAAGCILLIFSLSYAVGRSGRGVNFEPVRAQTLLVTRDVPLVPRLAPHGALPPLAHRRAAHRASARHRHRHVASAHPAAPDARGSAHRQTPSQPGVNGGTRPSPSGGRPRSNGGSSGGGGTHSTPAPIPVPRATPAPVTSAPDDGGAEAERQEDPSDPPPG